STSKTPSYTKSVSWQHHQEDGTPFLEVHHIEWLSKGGEDSVENAIALCPNCHRQAHYGDLTLLPVNK
ncbi:HNH endonuclease, partial [Escherichia coli O10]